MVEKVTTEKGKLNYGCYTKKQQKRTNLGIIIGMAIISIIGVVFIILDLNLIIGFVIGLVLTFFSMMFISSKNNVLINIINEFYNTLDYETCEKKIIELYKQPLHSETRKQLMMHQVTLLFYIDLKRACEIFDLIEMPTLKSNLGLYKTTQLLIKINNDETEGLYESILQLEKEYTDIINKQNIKTLKYAYDIHFTTKNIENIELQINNAKNKFMKINSYNNLMQYYKARNNFIKAKEYANKILEFNTNFHELNKEAKNILNK